MTTGGCGDPGAVGGMAVELFQLASLLVGEEATAMRLVEDALASLAIDPCLEPEQAREQTRRAVVRTALVQMASAQPAAFASRAAAPEHDPCVQDDDLLAAGVTQEDLRLWLDAQPGSGTGLRSGLRGWIEELPPAQRVVFVQRAVLGQGNEAAATLLCEAGGEGARDWTPQTVSQTFRQALCSLANALAHAPGAIAAQTV